MSIPEWKKIGPLGIGLVLIGLVLLTVGSPGSSARAQEGGQVSISPIDDTDFPTLNTYLDVRTAEGSFISDLGHQHVTVIEDGVRLDASRLDLLRSGAQFVLAVSPGDAFSIRDSHGVNRYDYLAEAIAAWANARGQTSSDDFSFLGRGGPEATHLSAINEWLSELAAYQPDEGGANSEFDTLARAIDIAADPAPRPGMGRAVLFITALPGQDVTAGVDLTGLTARANQFGVRVFVWLVAASEQFSSPGVGVLADLASGTGGSLFAFSGQEPIPDLESYLEPLRTTYYLEYGSRLTASGLHQVAVEVSREGWEALSLIQEFEFEVLPPSIAFVSPPSEISRTAPEERLNDPAAYSPKTLPLEVLIEFPDGHTRPIIRTSLTIDGVVVESHTTEPFEQFSWDLAPYTATGEHILVVEAEDSLELVSRSIETKVMVTLDIPPRSPWSIVSENRTPLAILSVVIAGAVLLLILVLGGRLRPGFVREFRRKRRRADPVTQPVSVRTEMPRRPTLETWMNRLPWPQRSSVPKAFAFLVPITESGDERSTPPLSISRDEEIFGREPDQVTLVLADPSVEAVHARLVRNQEGEFRVMDEGSVAGTWVNYTPISREGVQLEHGDLVHFGRLGFRFIMREPVRVRKPVVRPGEPLL
jgi:hypothetical protein